MAAIGKIQSALENTNRLLIAESRNLAKKRIMSAFE
jgi:hypothetical protein